MEGHESCVTTDGQVQRGDIAVANEWLGMAAQQVVIDPVEQARRAVAAAQANDGIDLGISECRMQITQTHVVTASQIAVFFINTGKHLQPITAGSHPSHRLIGVQSTRAGRRNDADQPFRGQCRHGSVWAKSMGRSNGHPWISL
ncbi:hypothetical protein D3C81_1386730 [compost metagenome]